MRYFPGANIPAKHKNSDQQAQQREITHPNDADQRPVIFANNVVPLSFFRVPLDQIDGQLHFREILHRY